MKKKNNNLSKKTKFSTEIENLEMIYKKYLVPMPTAMWSKTADLSQPSLLKQIPTRTIYSTTEAFNAKLG